ncbi:DUF6779 domain-containing protein [Corynebacterium aquilae]|uniref:DUF6779 domain-containing protein n=1 Tax=Corynebacterium aquilae TaxID=203263 RepID=UPI0009518F1F|nr:DUF6779 domain-containing protein [Corynebacterium aquilae]
MSEQERNRQQRDYEGSSNGPSMQLLAALLLTLAVIATVIMLVTNSTGAMKVAVIAALWSALIGFFLVGKYRYDAEQARENLAHERELLALELEKEQITHREQERLLEQTYMDSVKEHQDEVLVAIRAQLDEVRSQLEMLTGQDLSYEPTALRAEARRIAEIDAAPAAKNDKPKQTTAQPTNTQDDALDVVDVEATDVKHAGGRFDTGAFARVNWSAEHAPRQGSHRDDDPDRISAAEVAAKQEAERKKAAEQAAAKKKAEEEKKAAEAEAKKKAEAEKRAAEEAKAKKAQQEAEAKAKAEAEAKKQAEEKAAAAKKAEQDKQREAERQKAAAQAEAKKKAEELARKKAAEEEAVRKAKEEEKRREAEELAARKFRQAQEEVATKGGHHRAPQETTGGRRRRDESQDSVSVADLLKNLQGGTNASPRRRHRSED